MYFFDLDGTLLDSNGVWLDIDIAFLARYGISPVPPDYTDYVVHHTFEDAAEYTRQCFDLTETPAEIIAVWRDMARDAYAHQLPLKPGAREFLTRARAAGAGCALLTSCMPALCRSALEHHDLLPLLDGVYTTAELGLEKGDPALYTTLAQRLDLAPADCVLFDDSPVYCRAAQQAGWRVFAVPDPVFDDRADELRALCGPEGYPFSFFGPLP